MMKRVLFLLTVMVSLHAGAQTEVGSQKLAQYLQKRMAERLIKNK